MRILVVNLSGVGNKPVEPVAHDAAGGPNSADLDALATPALLTVEDGESCPAHFALSGQSNGTYSVPPFHVSSGKFFFSATQGKAEGRRLTSHLGVAVAVKRVVK